MQFFPPETPWHVSHMLKTLLVATHVIKRSYEKSLLSRMREQAF